jgi:hypothetical protein
VDSATVLSLARRYGELDGEIVYNYATNFVKVNNSLSSVQKTKLTTLRETWNTIPCSGAYLYSAKISMPEIMNTDFLFGSSDSSESDETTAYLNVGLVGDDLTIGINCVLYYGNQYRFNLLYSPTPTDTLIWRMDKDSFEQILNSSATCLSVGNDLKLNLIAEYEGVEYSFSLNYPGVSNDPLAWKLDIATFKAK